MAHGIDGVQWALTNLAVFIGEPLTSNLVSLTQFASNG